MRIRIVSTASGKHAVQVVSKTKGVVTVHKHLGTFDNEEDRQSLLAKAKTFIHSQLVNSGQLDLFNTQTQFSLQKDIVITSSRPLFVYQLLERIYNYLGFSACKDSLIKDLVIARIYAPTSKRETREILVEKFDRPYALKTIYRHLKKALGNDLKETFQQALIKTAKNYLHDDLRLVFYDVTTLAFASQVKTNLKDFGYSKDHRNQDTQVVVGLVVNKDGFPLYFDVFSGNTFEGSTFLVVVKKVKQLLSVNDLVVVADAGMLSQKNMDGLTRSEIQFVVGARTSNLSQKLLSDISSTLSRVDGAMTETAYNGYRFLADYSIKRANKDRRDREKQWKKAQQALTKPDMITRRYRFLKTDGKKNYALNERLLERVMLSEGIKGYLTNTKLDATTITTRYHDLWRVEKAFRMTKTDLEARPIFHSLDETIRAHLTIVFAGLAIARYLEIQTGMSIHTILKIAQNILTHTVTNTKTGETTQLQTTIADSIVSGKLSILNALGH